MALTRLLQPETPPCEACGQPTVNIVIRGVAVYRFVTCTHCNHHEWAIDGSNASIRDVVDALAIERPPTTGALAGSRGCRKAAGASAR